MKFNTCKTVPRKENPHGVDLRPLYNDSSAQVMHITLEPGKSLIPHITPVDVVFYVLEGKPTILVGNEKSVFERDTLVESPADIVHCISNDTEKVARVLVIKAPRPEKPTKLV